MGSRRLGIVLTWLIGTSIPCALHASAGGCFDPSLTLTVGAPGGELRAAQSVYAYVSGTQITAPDSRVQDGVTPFGGVFHAEGTITPAASLGYPVEVDFDLSGDQALEASGHRSRMILPLDLDLPGLPGGLAIQADYLLINDIVTEVNSGSVTNHLTLARFSPDNQSVTAGPLITQGAQATGTLQALTVSGAPDLRLTLEAEAFVAAPGGQRRIAGRLVIIIRSPDDFDGDGLSDAAELLGPDSVAASGDESDPGRVDGDGDGEIDPLEVARGGDALDPCDVDPAAATPACLQIQGDNLSWMPVVSCAGVPTYNLYRGQLDVLRAGGDYTQPVGIPGATGAQSCGLAGALATDAQSPEEGAPLYWLVTAVLSGQERSLGPDSQGNTRPNANPCP